MTLPYLVFYSTLETIDFIKLIHFVDEETEVQ